MSVAVAQSLLNGNRIEDAHPGDSSPRIGEVPRPGLGARHPRDFVATADQLGDERPADRSARSGDEDPFRAPEAWINQPSGKTLVSAL